MRTLSLPGVILSLVAAACTPTRTQMQDRFDRIMQECVGKNYSHPSTPKRCMGGYPPDEVIGLSSGNQVRAYDNFWQRLDIRRQPCRVSFEVEADLIMAIRYEGRGCYTPY